MTEPLNRTGLACAAGAFGFWGLFPIFMDELRPAGALEIVAHRALWSLAWCLLFIALARRWRPLFAALRNRRAVATLALAACFLAVNWGIFIFSVLSNRVSSSSLGYYINPLITVALGVVLLGERLHRAQKAAIALACVAVAVVGIDMGGIPWIAPALAVTFALYTLLKKRVGLSVDALTGMTIETVALTPVAALLVWLLVATGRTTWGDHGLGHDLWLGSTGLWTAGALIVFAAGTARLPLYVTGLMQYLTPTITFILAVTYFGETMSGLRWAGFGLVWVALVIVSVDSLRRSRASAELRVRAAMLPEGV
ncbi:MAG: EamA family transporter RarD [Demequinaceae bacterium]|nr:EamA family transporter RarD [Demequinaceae bacterium]